MLLSQAKRRGKQNKTEPSTRSQVSPHHYVRGDTVNRSYAHQYKRNAQRSQSFLWNIRVHFKEHTLAVFIKLELFFRNIRDVSNFNPIFINLISFFPETNSVLRKFFFSPIQTIQIPSSPKQNLKTVLVSFQNSYPLSTILLDNLQIPYPLSTQILRHLSQTIQILFGRSKRKEKLTDVRAR